MIPLYDDNPTTTFPFFTIAIIASCVLIFLWQLSLGNNMHAAVISLGMIPAVLFNYTHLPQELVSVPPAATVFTSMFLHGGWMHLLGNMLFLWIFGNNIEDAMGRTRFIIFYLLCGLAAAMAQALPNPQSTLPMIGASGAIAGVLGAYLVLYPRAKVLVLIPLGFFITTWRIAAGWVLGFWFLIQLYSSLGDSSGGGVAFSAHVGGFVTGILLVSVFKQKHIPLFAKAR